MDYGFLCLLPILVVIAIALKTKRIFEALVVGTLVAYISMYGLKFPSHWMDAFFRVATDYDHQWVLMVCAFFGALIALLGASHGTIGFSKKLEKFCKGPKTTQMVTWLLGIIIFIDDYLNIMTLSTCMSKLTDKQKVPREALAYIIDSTGAPVCSILPFSTWAVFFAGLFYSVPAVRELGYSSGLEVFIHIIPYAFYAIVAVIMVPLFIFGLIPKIGVMKKAYKRVKETGCVYSEESRELNIEDEDDVAYGGNALDFILPIATLLILAIIGVDLFLAILASIVVCFVIYIPRKIISLSRFFDLAMHGFCNMIPTVAVIFFVFVMQEAMDEIGIANFAIRYVQQWLSPTLFPAIVFIIVAALNFSIGSAWGTPAIVVPLFLPLAASLGANLYLVMGAIVSGATLGSHACFYSDATVLTSSCCRIQNMDHALSQLPYATIAMLISAVLYLIFGFIM